MFVPPAGPGTAAPAAPVGFTVPNIAGGKADPMLVAIGARDVRSGLGLRAVDVESKVASTVSKASSGLSVLLGLLVLPLLIGLGMLFLLRRRFTGGSAAPAAA